jgi:hypothetical protein
MNPPKVIQVIQSQVLRGKGKSGDPVRLVDQYHTLDGTFLAEDDAYLRDGKAEQE